MTRRRAVVYVTLAAGTARWWWRSGQPPFPLRLAILIWGMRGHKGTPEPVRSGPPEEALP